MWMDVCRNYLIERLNAGIYLIENEWKIICLELNRKIAVIDYLIAWLLGQMHPQQKNNYTICAYCTYFYLSLPLCRSIYSQPRIIFFVIYSFSKPSFYFIHLIQSFKYSLSTYPLFYYRSFNHPICAISLDSWSSILSEDLWKLIPNVFENEFVPYFVLSSAFYFSSNTKYFMCLHL
jgi:hypothetical protein